MNVSTTKALSKAMTGIRQKAGQRVMVALLAGSALSMPCAALAQTWDGSASTEYNAAANWSTNAVPTASGAVIIDTLINAPVISSNDTGRGGTISIGEAGTGLLIVTQGGALVLGSPGNGGLLSVGGSQTTNATGGNGTLRAIGAGTTISSPGGLAMGVAITVNSTGLLEILDGAIISSTSGSIGTAAGSNGTVTISGAGSRWDITSGAGGVRLGSLASDSARGTLNVLNGATVTYPGGVGWTLGHGGAINVAGAGSLLQVPTTVSTRGTISVTSGGVAEFSSIFLGGTTQPATLSVSGTGSRLTFDTFSFTGTQPNTISVSAGGQFVKTNVSSSGFAVPSGSSTLVTGQGSTLDLPGTLSLSGNLTVTDRAVATITNINHSAGNLTLTAGGQLTQTSASSSSFAEQAAVLISGAGTVFTTAGNIAINSNNPNAADFVIADGAQVNVNSISTSGLGFGGQRRLIVRDGAVLNIAAGLTLNRGVLEATNATVNFGTANVQMGSLFNGNVITLVNSAFTADSITSGNDLNVINLGGTASAPAGGVGAFNVRLVNLAVGAEFVLNHTATDYVIGNNFAGTGIIRHISGDTILTGNQTGASFFGQTLLTGGTLTINGTHGLSTHALNASGGATLGGTGQINGTVTIADATLAAGNSPGTLTFGNNLILGANSTLSFELGAPSGTAGVASDLVNVTGNLTLDGTLEVINAGGFGAGLYRLINYGGTLTDNGLALGSLSAGIIRSDLQIQTSVAQQVNLLVAMPTPTSFPFWDGTNTAGDGQIAGGSGTWSANGTNWTTTNAAINGAYNPDDVLIFTGAMAGEQPQQQGSLTVPQIRAATPSAAAGTVSVDDSEGAVTLANGLQFAVDGYTVTGDSLVLAATVPCGECAPLPGSVSMRVGDGSTNGARYVATIQSSLTGAAGLLKSDLGTLILSGTNSYSGGTQVTAGMLQGDAQSLQGAITIAENGTLLFAQGNNGTYAGALSGSGVLAKLDEGTLTLTGDSGSFTGISTVAGGELAVDGTLGSGAHALNVSGTATLSGGGQIGGNVVVEDGVVSPGGVAVAQSEQRSSALGSGTIRALATISTPSVTDRVGLLSISGDLTLTAPSILSYQLGDPAGQAGVTGDLINIGGNLTLDGTLTIRDAGGFGQGVYRLINYAGTLTDNGLGISVIPDGFTAGDLSVQTSVANQVNLLVDTSADAFNFWDGSNTTGNGTADGGTATWRADTSNWTIASSSRNGVFDPSQLLIFAGTAGTVTVDNAGGQVGTSSGLQFTTNGYRIEGDALALNGTVAMMRVGDGTSAGVNISATIASSLTGSARIDKTDFGTLILSGSNSYAGGTRVLGGVLQIGEDGALGALLAEVTLDGGTLRSTAALSTTRNFMIGSGGGTLDSGPNALTLAGMISGAGNLNLVGTATRILSGDSGSFSGTTTLTAGMLALPGSLGGGLTIAAPASLMGTGRAGSLDLAGTLSPGAAAGDATTFNVTGDLTFRAGSVLRVDVAANGANDRIEVGGRAVLEGGTVVVTALNPDLSYSEGTIFRIVNATGGRTGTFAGLSEASAFLDFSLGYDPTGAFLTTAVIAQFPDVAQTFNQTQAAGALENLALVAGADSLAAYNAILLLGDEPARAAFDATSGEIYPTLLAARQRAGIALAGRLAVRGRALADEGLVIWGGALGDREHIESDGNGARNTANSVGLESGFDYRAPDNRWAFGLGAGWQDDDVTLSARSSRASADAWHIGVYARYGSGTLGLSAVASAVHADADATVTRQINFGSLARTASSTVKLATTAAHGELRFGFGSDQLAFGPLVSLDHASTKLGKIAEFGANALNLAATAKRESWSRYSAGGFLRYTMGSGFADVAVRYVNHDHNATSLNLAMAGSPTGFAVRTAEGSRSALRVDASTEFSLGKRWAISGDLGATHGSKEGQIHGSMRLSYRF